MTKAAKENGPPKRAVCVMLYELRQARNPAVDSRMQS